jgi:hypothetical protein
LEVRHPRRIARGVIGKLGLKSAGQVVLDDLDFLIAAFGIVAADSVCAGYPRPPPRDPLGVVDDEPPLIDLLGGAISLVE